MKIKIENKSRIKNFDCEFHYCHKYVFFEFFKYHGLNTYVKKFISISSIFMKSIMGTMIYLNINSRNHIKKYFKRNNTFFGNYVKSRVYIYSNTVHFKNLGLCCSIVRVNQQMRTRISFLLILCLCIIVLKIKINKKCFF